MENGRDPAFSLYSIGIEENWRPEQIATVTRGHPNKHLCDDNAKFFRVPHLKGLQMSLYRDLLKLDKIIDDLSNIYFIYF